MLLCVAPVAPNWPVTHQWAPGQGTLTSEPRDFQLLATQTQLQASQAAITQVRRSHDPLPTRESYDLHSFIVGQVQRSRRTLDSNAENGILDGSVDKCPKLQLPEGLSHLHIGLGRGSLTPPVRIAAGIARKPFSCRWTMTLHHFLCSTLYGNHSL